MIRWNSNVAGFARPHAFGFDANFPPHPAIALPVTIYVSAGKIFLFTDAEWEDSFSFFFEATLRATSGEAKAHLFDITADAIVAGSEVTTTSATNVRLRSGAITLVDGNKYTAQYGTTSSSAGGASGGVLIVK